MVQPPTRFLIVNGDDFGASRGINQGIVEAHRAGVLTSTSLMVDMPTSAAAAAATVELPDLSVGLHVQLTADSGAPLIDFSDPESCRKALANQYARFEELMGQPPTHLDSHDHVHSDPRLLTHFLEVARERNIPLREHGPVRCVSSFYGQKDGRPDLEKISVECLVRILRNEVGAGIFELECHPGYPDLGFRSAYFSERRYEANTLCDPRVPRALAEEGIQLISYRDLGSVLASVGG